jgi:hypothetical protein
MTKHDDLPEGITVLHREPPQPSVELALELARLGGSLKLVRAAGGEDAIEALHGEAGAADGNGSPDPAAAVGTGD